MRRNARTIQLQMTRRNASSTLPQSGPRHQIATNARTSATSATTTCVQPDRHTRRTGLMPLAPRRGRFPSRSRTRPRGAARSSATSSSRQRVRARPRPCARAAHRPRRDRTQRPRARPGRSARPRRAASGVSTSRYPGMSDATAGSAHANARVSTMPKLSWPIDGATSAFERSSVAVSSSWLRKPTTSSPSSETRSRLRRRRTASGSAPATVRRSPVRSSDLRPRSQQHLEALPRLLAAGEDDAVLALARRRRVRHEHAVRNHLVLARQPAALGLASRAPTRRCGGRSGRS